MDKLRLRTVLGNHPHIQAVKGGELRSDLFDLDFAEFTPTNAAFKPMVREQAFDVCEMAIVTYLMARAHGKPLVLLPAAMVGRFQHGHALCRADRGAITPADLEGKRVGIRSFTTTTGAWMRGILANDHGVNLDRHRLGHLRGPACRRICRPHRTCAEGQHHHPDAEGRRARSPCWARPRTTRRSSHCSPIRPRRRRGGTRGTASCRSIIWWW